MPATAFRPATPAQLRFIETLMAERDAATLYPLLDELLAARAGQPMPRDLIDRLMALPRSTTTVNSSRDDGVVVATPREDTRAGRMLNAGGIEATASLADGRHVTVRINTRRRSGRGWANCAPTDEGARTNIRVLDQRVGWLTVEGGVWKLTLRSRSRSSEVQSALRGILHYAAGMALPTTVKRVQEASRCGRCLRPLTDPVSIDRGIGPECLGRVTGSRHAAIEANTRQAAHNAAAFGTRVVVQEDADNLIISGLPGPTAASLTANLTAIADALTTPAPAPTRVTVASAAEIAKARDLIVEALDSYFGDPQAAFATRIFDQLTAR